MEFISAYIDWHYIKAWPKILVLWRNLILFPFYYFSIPLHIKTLFSPWRRQLAKKGVGFHLDDILGVIFFNLTSRILGAIVRASTIFYGLLFMILGGVLGGILAFVWIIIPGLTIPLYLSRKPDNEIQLQKILQKANGDIPTLVNLLFNTNQGQFVLMRLGLSLQILTTTDTSTSDDLTLPKLTKLSDLFVFLSSNYRPLKEILSKYQITPNDVSVVSVWYEKLYSLQKTPLILDLESIKNTPGIGVNWSYGYTVEFDKYAKDLTKQPTPYPFLLGREEEFKKIQQVLIKTSGNNVLIVGEPGTARHLLVQTLAFRILSGDCLLELSHKRIISLDMHALSSAKPTIAEVKGLASEILEEAEAAGNIIIFIDEIDKYVIGDDERIDYTSVFAKFAESNVGLIGITTPSDYNRYIDPNSTLVKLFEKIEILPPKKEVVLAELELSIVPVLEARHKVFITYQALVKTIEDADRYISATPFPAKAIEILDQASVYTKTEKRQLYLTGPVIDEFLSSKLHIPMGDLQKSEKEKLANLEDYLHRRVIDQEEAVRAVSSALRRARLDISGKARPIGAFLFLGPTGVGKTETAKALAEAYFGNEDTMLRFDMSQYQKEEGLERLIGSIKTGIPGELTSKLRQRPFSLLLLDEFEKADKTIYNLFLTLIDEGYITDANGKKVDAKNIIVIATSNAGAEYVRQCITKGITGDDLNSKLINFVQTEKIFSPELINRFDAVIVFSPLSEGHLRQIARLQLEALNKRLSQKEIGVAITDDLINRLASIGYDPQFGGRAMRRVISEKIEDEVAKRLLSGSVKKGEKIHINF